MASSMKALFFRRNIPNQVISLRNSLWNHFGGLAMSFREASGRFRIPADGRRGRLGCPRPWHHPLFVLPWYLGEDPSDTKSLAFVIPEWVLAGHQEACTVEGILVDSKISRKELPPKPWHTYMDWNLHVQVDPQYEYLQSAYNIEHNKAHDSGVMECEWGRGPRARQTPSLHAP
jgi:hypothetical protein